MKKLLLIFALLFCMISYSNAQDYNTGIGLRGGLSNGLTVKTFIAERTALEFLVASRWKGFSITGLYEIHNQAFNTNGLKWYYGVGAHVGFWDGDNVKWADNNDSYTVIGFDGILGLEYSFPEIPINLSIDWKPEFNVSGYSGFWGDSGAISIRYIF
ncbi:MAG: hypothetical protein CVU00_08320 [Bacteroidetes bacterium HGW-Bacteroidetes-17]|jgi:hypothetical protein|nr:MAG: hypothetical protein CVU00_08320 [Bacteroidetes bacterium HGW-Bacteroidetes-17]